MPTSKAKAKPAPEPATAVLRQHAETQFAEELEAIAAVDTRHRPPNWKLSPWAVSTYLLGGTLDNGFVVGMVFRG